MRLMQRFGIDEHDKGMMTVNVNGRRLNLCVSKVRVRGGSGETETEVLFIQEHDGDPITIFPRAANVLWVQ